MKTHTRCFRVKCSREKCIRVSAKNIIGVLLLFVLLISVHTLAYAQSSIDQPSESGQALSVAAPDLSEIIPAATELEGRLVAHKIRVAGLLDVSVYERNIAGFNAKLEAFAGQLKRIKETQDFRYRKLVVLREAIKQENRLFEAASNPLNQAIRQLGAWRKEWLAEKDRWRAWQASIHKEEAFKQLTSTFGKADKTIYTALNLIHPKLSAMLTLQEKTGNISTVIDTLLAELDALIPNTRRDALNVVSPPVFSSQYFSQFRGLWDAVQKCLDEILWPDNRFFQRQGWILLLQGFLSIFVIIVIYRNREALTESKRWRFLAVMPFSTGFFLSYMTMVFMYEYMDTPGTWKLAMTMVGGTAFARLSGGLVKAPWKKQFIYGLILVLIVSRLLSVLNFPTPILRLYTITAALAAMLMCLRWAGKCTRTKEAGFYAWAFRLGALFFGVVIIAELWGKNLLSLYLFIALIRSLGTVLVFMLFMYILRGALEWLFLISPFQRMFAFQSDASDTIIKRVAHLINLFICGLLLLPAVLMVWGVFNNLEEATKGLLALGFNLGSLRISVGLIMISASIIYVSLLMSWIFQKLLINEVFIRTRLEKGARVSIARLVHYVVISVGFLFAVSALGIEITKLTLMLSALGVGIGFGLQGVVNNFVSGLILLFEQPVRVGDYIEFNGSWSEIKHIGLRATSVQTFDHADVSIPNADLVSQSLTNWTLTNREVRLIIPVGVAYGSDVPLVMETLGICAKNHRMVAAYPKPNVLFLSFGESSLNFELRVWVLDADFRLEVQSELHQEIDRRFREANIEIAFPQHDLHVRSLDESISFRHRETVR